MSGDNRAAAAILLATSLIGGGWLSVRLRHTRWLTALVAVAGYAIVVLVLGWPELVAAVIGVIVGLVCWCAGCALWESEGEGGDDGH